MDSSFKSVRHWLQRGALDHASEELDQMDGDQQSTLEGLRLRAFIFQAKKEWERLEELGKKLEKIAPESSDGPFCIAQALHGRGRSKEAIKVIEDARPLFEKEIDYLYTAARLNCGAGDVETALKLMEQAELQAPGIKDKALLESDFEPIWVQLTDSQ